MKKLLEDDDFQVVFLYILLDLLIWLKTYTILYIKLQGEISMKHIKTVNKPYLQATIKTGGCGECQASCQSACKTSYTVGNQVYEKH